VSTLLPDFSSRASRPARAGSPDRPWTLAGAGLVLLALALAVSARSRLDLARAAEADARAASREARARVTAARAAQDPAALTLAVRARLTGVAAPPRVLGDLQALMPAAVRLEQAALVYGEHVDLELRVVARSAGDYDAFVERLSQATAFQVASMGPENREGEVRALIRLRYAKARPVGP
jgi:hypothetical protein